MTAWLRVVIEAARGQLLSFVRVPVTTILAMVLPLNLLLLMSLFALTGYNAPTALVMDEDTPYARAFVRALRDAHNSFALRPMDRATAERELRRRRLVAMIEIPAGFDATIAVRPEVRLIRASMSASYHMLSAPAAPAPTAMHRSAVKPIIGWMCPGAIMMLTNAVNTTSDMTRGFINAK